MLDIPCQFGFDTWYYFAAREPNMIVFWAQNVWVLAKGDTTILTKITYQY